MDKLAKWLIISFVSVLSIAVFWTFGMEIVSANEIVVKQSIMTGKLSVWKEPGIYFQGFGNLTRYKKSNQFWFSQRQDEGTTTDQSIRVRFNDGGHANISGSLSFDLPDSEQQIIALHSTFGTQEQIELRLIQQSVTKAVYMTGPLMSSKESAGEKRADLINFIADQSSRGVYKTEVVEKEIPDLIAGEIEVVEVIDVPDLDENGKPKLDSAGKPILKKEPKTFKKPRMKVVTVTQPKVGKSGLIDVQEASSVEKFGIKIYNLSINGVAYEDAVEKQIKAQQQATMEIQLQMAKAKEAEQKAITVEKEGEASAAAAKWTQEVKKAQAITEAEQRRAVAMLSLESSKLEKEAQIERAKGESEAKRMVMEADGALEKKIAAYVEVQKAYAAELGKQRWVPEVVMGGMAQNAGDILNLWQVKAARDLALDISVKK